MPGRRTQQQLSGQQTERDAENFLRNQGLSLICKNFRCKPGEIDLIMREGDIVVFVEVRLRRNHHYGSGAETVTVTKQGRTIKAAQVFLQRNPHLAMHICRFDVISSHGGDPAAGHLQWIKDAYQLRLS